MIWAINGEIAFGIISTVLDGTSNLVLLVKLLSGGNHLITMILKIGRRVLSAALLLTYDLYGCLQFIV